MLYSFVNSFVLSALHQQPLHIYNLLVPKYHYFRSFLNLEYQTGGYPPFPLFSTTAIPQTNTDVAVSSASSPQPGAGQAVIPDSNMACAAWGLHLRSLTCHHKVVLAEAWYFHAERVTACWQYLRTQHARQNGRN
jgi:hypothetical protein